jgi:LacI family transcriptional regulator
MARRGRVTLGDIARQVGVSPATVSAALNTQKASSTVSDATRQRIHRIASQMGYDLSHLRARRGHAESVAVLCPSGQGPNSAVLYSALVEVCEVLTRQETRVTLHTCDTDVPAEECDRLRRLRIDGAIVIGQVGYSELLVERGIPCVHIGEVPEGTAVSRVHVDNELGGRLVGEHLWALGHRCVGVVQLAFGTVAERRVAGLETVWSEHGSEIAAEHILNLEHPFEEALREGLPRVLARRRGGSPPPTALFCNADWVASCAMRDLRAMGLSIPADVSVVGFDDAHYASLLDPPLTTVRQPFPEIGALAVQLLHELLRSGQVVGRSYVLPCQLVVRGSTSTPSPTVADLL